MKAPSLIFLMLAFVWALTGPAQPIRSRTEVVTLGDNLPPEAVPENDRGRIADSFALDHITLLLRRSSANEVALAQLLDDQHDRRSANYHRWLTAREFGRRFGPSQATSATLT